ncbi:ImmA/IrrE family metallo-endopeptidase [Indiicoccus explosivorum]|uniref:ImmA/IrrE family metallo-endopeptidase n=1 Tax=Indiicoccus explosivorum TaxID=1917864 RepID=UPI000B43F637|nr:ImmA/IrrE family metallo-endopeptidase [Indiicoccus explosivorum]
MCYTYGTLEEYITKMLRDIDVFHPHQMNIEVIAPRLGYAVHYYPYGSAYADNVIFLDDRLLPEEQWQAFGHEVCHAKLHEGDQRLITAMMRDYQEVKANNFSQLFCIPTFMLQRLQLPNDERRAIWVLQELFGVNPDFAQKRLEQYCRNLCSR